MVADRDRGKGRDDGDAALVKRARRGDTDALALLLDRHRPLLLALCRRTLGDGVLAEDAAQEAMLQALPRLHALRQAERFGPWLAGIGLNVCRMWLRARSREGTPREAWADGDGREARIHELRDVAPESDPAARFEAAEVARSVRQAVAGLPRGQRAAVGLVYLSGLSYAETAAHLGIEVGAVRTRLFKARTALRAPLRLVWGEDKTIMTAETQTEATPRVYHCTFCGKGGDAVERMIAGPPARGGSVICNECVDLCNGIIAEARANEARGAGGATP